MSGSLDWSAARRAAATAAPLLGVTELPLEAALGRLLLAPLVTPIPLPHYASSAMDGWAVRGAGPWRLIASPGDGSTPGSTHATASVLGDGEAIVIVTGGLVPEGTEAVLRVEAGREVHVAGEASTVIEAVGETGRRDIAERKHIRAAGTEAAAGEKLLEAGAVLTPPRLALLAATGADRVLVRRRPRVALVLTGDEVVESGTPGPGQVRDSFRIALPPILEALDAEIVAVHRVGDDIDATRAALLADHVELVVTTGGTGGSHADHVRAAVAALGGTFVVPGLATRPGGPTFLAQLDDRLVLGLPGNPHAAVIGLLTLGGPLLGMGASGTVTTTAAVAIEGRAGVTRLVTATVEASGAGAGVGVGAGVATPTDHAGSGMLRGLAVADLVLVVPEGGVAAGAPVEALRLPWAR